MHLRSKRASFYLSLLSALAALMFTGTFAHAQALLQLDWGGRFNNSAGNDTEDNWVANSFTITGTDRTHIVAIILPIGSNFNNQPISALIYKGFDLQDPVNAGGGLQLVHRYDTTITTTVGQIVTLTLDTPVDFQVNDIMYAAVLLPGVAPTDALNPNGSFPFYEDEGTAGGLGQALGTQSLGRSFFDVGPALSAPWDPSQGVANITVMGGTHPIVGPGVNYDGNLALWVYATAAPPP